MKCNHFISVVLLLASTLFLTSCGRTPVVKIDRLQNETGDYQYEELSWGSDKNAAENSLGITFDQTINSSATLQLCATAAGAYSLNGLPSVVECEFDATGLCALTFRVTPTAGEIETYWDELVTALTSQYGSVEPVYLDTDSDAIQGTTQLTVQSENYLWDNSGTIHTALSVSKISINGKTPRVELSIYVIPEGRTE